MEENKEIIDNDLDNEQLVDFSKVKKKKTKKGKKSKLNNENDNMDNNNEVKELFSYEDMYTRISEYLVKNNPYSKKKNTLHVKNIELEKIGGGSKKTRWNNFKEFCNSINRTPEHFSSFLSSELEIESILQGDKLLMEGKRLDKEKIMNLSKKYIIEFVKCALCSDPKTILFKDPNTRKMVIKCEVCQSQRTIVQIKSKNAKI